MSKHLKEKKVKRAGKKTAPKKQIENKDDKFNFNEEIVIGISVPVEDKKDKNKKNRSHNKKTTIKKMQYNKNYPKKTKNAIPKKYTGKTIDKKRHSKTSIIIKLFLILAIIIAGIVFILVSPQFNVKNINVSGNSHVDSQTIINLSNIEKDKNIFSFSRKNIMSNILQNPYIEQVYIRRSLPDTIEIIVKEREATFNIQYGNAYIYINNRGYILETSNEKIEKPIIYGISSKEEELKPGLRLCEEDLDALSDILKIMEIMTNNELAQLVTKINIEDKEDYVLELETEQKTVHIGDISNLGTKILYVKNMIEREKGIKGEIFVNEDLNTENPFFRESV